VCVCVCVSDVENCTIGTMRLQAHVRRESDVLHHLLNPYSATAPATAGVLKLEVDWANCSATTHHFLTSVRKALALQGNVFAAARLTESLPSPVNSPADATTKARALQKTLQTEAGKAEGETITTPDAEVKAAAAFLATLPAMIIKLSMKRFLTAATTAELKGARVAVAEDGGDGLLFDAEYAALLGCCLSDNTNLKELLDIVVHISPRQLLYLQTHHDAARRDGTRLLCRSSAGWSRFQF
jgi:hypothetical protein